MSLELIDLRAKVSRLGNVTLNARADALQIDKSELVRRIIDEWAEREVHGASLLMKALRAEGIAAAPQGTSGNRGE